MLRAENVWRVCRSEWARLAAASLGAAVLIAVIFALFGAASPLTVLEYAAVHAGITCGLAGLVVPRVAGRLSPRSALFRWGILVPLLLGLSVIGTLIACAVLAVVGLDDRDALRACFVDDFRINVLVTLVLGVGLTLYGSQRRRLDEVTLELRTRELEYERAQKAALEARLASLESRVHPHFLFNTLNAILALIHEDPDRAERTVERLAALLRFSLDATAHGVVPLADELLIVADYLEIEKTRLGERLSYRIDVDPDLRSREIPPLSVQTLVENSIKHAIAPRPAGGRVHVAAAAEHAHLTITVWDDGPGFSPAAIREGHGLDNLRARLQTRYGATATLDVHRRDGGTLVTVRVPGARRTVPA